MYLTIYRYSSLRFRFTLVRHFVWSRDTPELLTLPNGNLDQDTRFKYNYKLYTYMSYIYEIVSLKLYLKRVSWSRFLLATSFGIFR